MHFISFLINLSMLQLLVPQVPSSSLSSSKQRRSESCTVTSRCRATNQDEVIFKYSSSFLVDAAKAVKEEERRKPPLLQNVLLNAVFAFSFACCCSGTRDALASSSSVVSDLRLVTKVEGEYDFYSKGNHSGEDFSNRDLRDATFVEVEARAMNFSKSDLRGSVFTRAILAKSDFSGSDCSNVLFDYALLRESNFENAVAVGANFVRADMGEMNIKNADFTDAIIDRYQAIDLCERAEGVNPYTKVDTKMSLGCEMVSAYEGSGRGGKIEVK